METYFDATLAETVKFVGGHQVPAGQAEVARIAGMVQEVWTRRN
jgi:hypothetical protein